MHPVDTADPPETTERSSAYPPQVDGLMPQARDLAELLGEVPSRNKLMAEFKIGAPKANAVRDRLLAGAQAGLDETAGSDDSTGLDDQDARKIEEPADGHPDVGSETRKAGGPTAVARPLRPWPLLLLAAPAFVSIWSGWVGLGGLTGFGVVHPLPGIADDLAINSAITLPIGVETYAAFALRAWLSRADIPGPARRFAKWSAVGSLVLGAAGQVAYHVMAASGMTAAPWPVTTAVSCLPVAVLGMGAALAGLLRRG